MRKKRSIAVVVGALVGAMVGFIILLASEESMPYPQLFIIQRAPLALVIGAAIGGLIAGTISFLGLGFRKLELICGVACAAVATLLSLFILKSDWDAAHIVEQQFAVFRELFLVLLLFMFPGLLVAIGSYAHVAKQRFWGRFVLAVGCVAAVGSFLFLFAILPMLFVRVNWWSLLNLSFVLLAILTIVFSLVARKESSQHL